MTEYGSDGVSTLPPQAFGWNASDASYSSNPLPPVQVTSNDTKTPTGWDHGVRFVDLNGDGITDAIVGWRQDADQHFAA